MNVIMGRAGNFGRANSASLLIGYSRRYALRIGLALLAAACRPAWAIETDDTLAGALVVPANAAGQTVIAGELADFKYLEGAVSSLHTLATGLVNSHTFAGLPASTLVAVQLDNDAGAGTPDTVMLALDPFGAELVFDDDGSLLGNGLASGFFTNVNADGTLRLQVSGFGDFDFDGLDDEFGLPHGESGRYEVTYRLGALGDVDFYRFVGLAPGTAWSAETLVGGGGNALDTILTQYDPLGPLLDQNDDIGLGNLLSKLSGVVPASGAVILAVTAFADFDNAGGHAAEGPYGLKIVYTAVPEPHAIVLAVFGVMIARRWRP